MGLDLIKTIPFRLPPLTEQQEIVRRVEALFALTDQIEARYAKATAHIEKLTQSILAKAFRGELVPQDPNDESASTLLERLRADWSVEAAQPDREKTPPKRTMKRLSQDTVRDVILSMKKDKFGFPELREAIQGDYDALTEALFLLLAEKKPVLKQVFNKKTKIMQFKRSKG